MILLAEKALKTLDNLASLQNTFKTLTHITLSKPPALSQLVIDRRAHIGFSGAHPSRPVPQLYLHQLTGDNAHDQPWGNMVKQAGPTFPNYLQSLLIIDSLTLENLLRFSINQRLHGHTHWRLQSHRIRDELVTVGVTIAAAELLMPWGGQSRAKRPRMEFV